MTLVLGTCVGDAVVLGADSQVQMQRPDGTVTSGIDRKLFRFARAGVATHGGSTKPVPAAFDSDTDSNWSVSEIIEFILSQFGGQPMGALVGGFEADAPGLWDVDLRREPQQRVLKLTAPQRIVLRGDHTVEIDQQTATIDGVIAQMTRELSSRASPFIGPPFQFLVID